MAYNVGWDESVPAGSTNANTLDTVIQEMKESLRERLEDTFPNWADDLIDPKKVHVQSGLAANRPSSDLNAGQVYLATDTGDVSFYDGSQWRSTATGDALTAAAVLGVDTLSNRPAASAGDAPLFFYATDEGALYVDIGAAWAQIAGTGGGGSGSAIRVTLTGTTPSIGLASDLDFEAAKLLVLYNFTEFEIIASRCRITGSSTGATDYEPDVGTETIWDQDNTLSNPGGRFYGTDDGGSTQSLRGDISLRRVKIAQNSFGDPTIGTLAADVHINNPNAASTFDYEVVFTLLPV